MSQLTDTIRACATFADKKVEALPPAERDVRYEKALPHLSAPYTIAAVNKLALDLRGHMLLLTLLYSNIKGGHVKDAMLSPPDPRSLLSTMIFATLRATDEDLTIEFGEWLEENGLLSKGANDA